MQVKKDGQQAEIDGGTVTGYASTFDREPDSYGDVVAKGAFTDTLKEWAEKRKQGVYIPLLYGHNTDDPDYNIGKVIDAKEDDKGLLITAEFDPKSEKAQTVRNLIKDGRLYQFSFAFDVLEQGETEIDGKKYNELQKLDIYEVSLVQIPANQNAEVVEVKSHSIPCEQFADLKKRVDEVAAKVDGLQSITFPYTVKQEGEHTVMVVPGEPYIESEQTEDKAEADGNAEVKDLLEKAHRIIGNE